MIQYRKASGPGGVASMDKWYAPHRDISYCWPSIVEEVVKGLLSRSRSAWFSRVLEALKAGDGDMAKAAKAYVRFLEGCSRVEVKSPKQALEEAGWFKVSEGAQAAFCIRLGMVMSGAFYTCLREICNDIEEPPLNTSDLHRLVEQLFNPRRKSLLGVMLGWLSGFTSRVCGFFTSKKT